MNSCNYYTLSFLILLCVRCLPRHLMTTQSVYGVQLPTIGRQRKSFKKVELHLHWSTIGRAQWVPDTRPEPKVFVDTRTRPDFFFKIIGYFGYRVFQKFLTFAPI